jgi:hypothetical protein
LTALRKGLEKQLDMNKDIVRACNWEEQGFAKYNVLPAKGKPIKSWGMKMKPGLKW